MSPPHPETIYAYMRQKILFDKHLFIQAIAELCFNIDAPVEKSNLPI